jgi:large subunit ribosomal protein L33
MSKNKSSRLIIIIECIECRNNFTQRSKGVSRYNTKKNRKNTSDRLELNKYCKYCNKHTKHKEIK